MTIFRCVRVEGCLARVTDWRGYFDGIERDNEGGVKMSHGHDNFMCDVSVGRKAVENVSPSGGLFELFGVHEVLIRFIKGKRLFNKQSTF